MLVAESSDVTIDLEAKNILSDTIAVVPPPPVALIVSPVIVILSPALLCFV